MTEQAAPAASPVVLGPPPPKHESPLERAEEWFHGHEPQIERDAVTVAEELKPVLQDHFAGVFALAAEVLGKPELRAIAPAVLELAESAARIGGLAL